MFSECKALSTITLGNEVTKIVGYEFSRCSNLQKLVMSYGATVISNDVFVNSDYVTVYVYDNTYALKWAQERGIPYKLIGAFTSSPVGDLRATAVGKNGVLIT